MRDSVSGKDGTLEKSHRWTSEPNTSLPQWIELTFPQPIALREVHLTWDTGFVRPLMLTPSPNEKSWGIRGPQPETASHYRVFIDGALPIKSLRVVVEATHGVSEARLFEIRAYGE